MQLMKSVVLLPRRLIRQDPEIFVFHATRQIDEGIVGCDVA